MKKKFIQKLKNYKAYIGIGGSGYEGNDIDLVWIQPTLKFDYIKEVKEELEHVANKRVSITPMTQLMLTNKNTWGHKFIVMTYKGIEWINIPPVMPHVSREELKNMVRQRSGETLNRFLRALVEDKTQEKINELLIQEIVMLTD